MVVVFLTTFFFFFLLHQIHSMTQPSAPGLGVGGWIWTQDLHGLTHLLHKTKKSTSKYFITHVCVRWHVRLLNDMGSSSGWLILAVGLSLLWGRQGSDLAPQRPCWQKQTVWKHRIWGERNVTYCHCGRSWTRAKRERTRQIFVIDVTQTQSCIWG